MSIETLRQKLAVKKSRVDLRYKYYEQKDRTFDFQISTPPQLMWLNGALSWCGKAVDSMADRLVFAGFDPDDDQFNFQQVFELNNPDIFFDAAITSALISSCCFVYVSPDKDGMPRLQVIDGGNATGTLDTITGMLKEGYAILDTDDNGIPTVEAYFTPGKTEFWRDGKQAETLTTGCPFPLLVPIIYRPDDKRPFGHSRISRTSMYCQDMAKRILKRSEINAEYYSYPQKFATGLNPDMELIDKFKASMSAMLMFDKDEDGDSPKLGQFTTGSMTPHIDMLKMVAAVFCSETGMTLDDLGFASGSPASYQAIKAQHEMLRLMCRRAQRCFGAGFRNVGAVAACLRDNMAYERRSFYNEQPMWEPLFELDISDLAGAGDAVQKIGMTFPEYFDETKLKNLVGV